MKVNKSISLGAVDDINTKLLKARAVAMAIESDQSSQVPTDKETTAWAVQVVRELVEEANNILMGECCNA